MATHLRPATPLDTSIEARHRQIEAWIAMGPQGRVRLAAAMSDEIQRVGAEGLAARTLAFDALAKRPR